MHSQLLGHESLAICPLDPLGCVIPTPAMILTGLFLAPCFSPIHGNHSLRKTHSQTHPPLSTLSYLPWAIRMAPGSSEGLHVLLIVEV